MNQVAVRTKSWRGRAAAAPVPQGAAVAVTPALAVHKLVVPLPSGPLTLLDWQIGRGEKVAVIGRNGVGKTSVTEALLGVREGAIVQGQMLGFDVALWRRRPELRRRLGVQLQRVAFPGRPRVRELVDTHRVLYPCTSARVMAALGIAELAPRLYEFLSRGETQRVDLFLAMAHEPEILFLDEPFTGLDPQFTKQLAALIRDLVDVAVVMSCHTVEELALVDKVAWLTGAGIARYDRPDTLRRELVGDFRLAVQCEDEASAVLLAHELRCRLAVEPAGAAASPRRVLLDGLRCSVTGTEPMADLARALADRPAVVAVESGRSSLQDLLRHCAREG